MPKIKKPSISSRLPRADNVSLRSGRSRLSDTSFHHPSPVPTTTSHHTTSYASGSNTDAAVTPKKNGITVLYDGGLQAIIDIVFVHGLTGDAYTTWLCTMANLCWPRDLLPKDMSDARIVSFGYDADVVNLWNPLSMSRVSNHAEQLTGDIVRLRELSETERRPIIFVAHCLGGLVVKHALSYSKSVVETHLQQIEQFTYGIIFLGTPHRGTDLAKWAKFGIDIANFLKKRNEGIGALLQPGSEMLREIEVGFHKLLRIRKKQGFEVAITCFYEELGVTGIGTIVPPHSSEMRGYPFYGIHSNHKDMTKYSSREEPAYNAILGEIQRWKKAAIMKSRSFNSEASQRGQSPSITPYGNPTNPFERINNSSGHANTLQQSRILESLMFQEMNERREAIATAHGSTYGWIFDESPEALNPWSNFIEWLRCGSEVYWINGKAGSGKSTLMEFLIQDSRTKHFLKEWSGNKDCIILTHFFWKPGSTSQKSLIGLLRSLLHQMLHLSSLWKTYSETWANDEIYFPSAATFPICNQQRLTTTIRSLLDRCGSDLNACIFIDGLDEIEGDQDKAMLNEWVVELSQLNHVRICVSSRPLQIFEDTFRTFPMLKLQDLNEKDITAYVNERFVTYCNNNSAEKYKTWLMKSLTYRVVNSAEGVFLWAVLVVESLLDGLRNEDSEEALEARLEALPTDLNKLYATMLRDLHMNEGYLEEAKKYFALLDSLEVVRMKYKSFSLEGLARDYSHSRDISILHCALACTPGLSTASAPHPGEISSSELRSQCDRMDVRIRTCCRGLLEVSGSVRLPLRDIQKDMDYLPETAQFLPYIQKKVVFLHRSVYDFFHQSEDARYLHLAPGQQHVIHAHVLASALILYPEADRRYNDIEILGQCAYIACMITNSPQVNLIDRLSQILRSAFPENGGQNEISDFFKRQLPAVKDFAGLVAHWYLYQYLDITFHRSLSSSANLDYLMTCVLSRMVSRYDNYRFLKPFEQAASGYFKTLSLLMQLGASPNVEFEIEQTFATHEGDFDLVVERVTPWEQFLVSSYYYESWKTMPSCWIKTIDNFILHGANPHQEIRLRRRLDLWTGFKTFDMVTLYMKCSPLYILHVIFTDKPDLRQAQEYFQVHNAVCFAKIFSFERRSMRETSRRRDCYYQLTQDQSTCLLKALPPFASDPAMIGVFGDDPCFPGNHSHWDIDGCRFEYASNDFKAILEEVSRAIAQRDAATDGGERLRYWEQRERLSREQESGSDSPDVSD